MTWYEVIKQPNMSGARMYTGTCPKCKQFVKKGEPCPKGWPAESPEYVSDVRFETCPMKVPDTNIHIG